MYDIRIFEDYSDYANSPYGNGGVDYSNVSAEDVANIARTVIKLGGVIVVMPVSGDEEGEDEE